MKKELLLLAALAVFNCFAVAFQIQIYRHVKETNRQTIEELRKRDLEDMSAEEFLKECRGELMDDPSGSCPTGATLGGTATYADALGMSRDNAALCAIMAVESGGRQVGLHQDKRSFGYFGLTAAACKEVGQEWPPENELETARAYLELMKKRHCAGMADEDEATDRAIGFYHGGDANRRAAYLAKVKSASFDSRVAETFYSLLENEVITAIFASND